MKRTLLLLATVTLFYSCQPSETEEVPAEEADVVQNGIRWTGEDEAANAFAIAGIDHWVNVEFREALAMFEHAVAEDPTLFAPHVMLSMMTGGEISEMHKSKAIEHSANENETSKLFVSLIQVEGDSIGVQRREIWKQMRALSNGPFIHHMYARSLGNPDDQTEMLAELDKVIEFCNENGITSIEAASYNIKAYVLQQSGDMEGATKAVEKYVETYNGYNALDSRAEMYLFAGDTTRAVEWYKKVLEKNPFATGARDHLDELEPDEDE